MMRRTAQALSNRVHLTKNLVRRLRTGQRSSDFVGSYARGRPAAAGTYAAGLGFFCHSGRHINLICCTALSFRTVATELLVSVCFAPSRLNSKGRLLPGFLNVASRLSVHRFQPAIDERLGTSDSHACLDEVLPRLLRAPGCLLDDASQRQVHLIFGKSFHRL